MAINNVKLPVGISDFHKLRQNEYYYVDKTNLIKELLESRIAEVTLITRPRRRGTFRYRPRPYGVSSDRRQTCGHR